MLTIKENLRETIRGGKPDRYVNQFEFMGMIYSDPINRTDPWPQYGEEKVTDLWGVTRSYPVGTPGPFPLDSPDLRLLQDISDWKKVVKKPSLVFSDELWEDAQKDMEQIDRNEVFASILVAPGLFERLHSFLGMEDALTSFYEDPEETADLIKYIEEWEMRYAELLCEKLKPECIYHHDDWGSQLSTFFSPAMFEEFFLESYKHIYQCYKDNGVELIVHHSDSYAQTFVPMMIEIGVDIWQGVMTTNDISQMIKDYGGKITFMGGINSAAVDHPGWTEEEIEKEVIRVCKTYGKKFFIPNTTIGGDTSIYPGVYDCVSATIKKINESGF